MRDQVARPSTSLGHIQAPDMRRMHFDQLLWSVGRQDVAASVTVKARPLDADGRQVYIWPDDYPYEAEGIEPGTSLTPQNPAWLVSGDDPTPIVWEEHETGLEVAVGIASIASAVAACAPYISRFISAISKKGQTQPESVPATVTEFSVEVHADALGYPVASVDVRGELDEAATESLIAAGAQAAAEAFAAAEMPSRSGPA